MFRSLQVPVRCVPKEGGICPRNVAEGCAALAGNRTTRSRRPSFMFAHSSLTYCATNHVRHSLVVFMRRTICLIAALFAFTLWHQPKAYAQAPSYFVEKPRASKGTQMNPYSIQELMALTPPPPQAWVYGQIQIVESSIASDPLDVDVTFTNRLKVRVNLAKFQPVAAALTRRPLKAVSATDGVQIIDSSKPGPPAFDLKNTGQIMVGLNIKRPISTGIVGKYLPPRNSKNATDGDLGIPK